MVSLPPRRSSMVSRFFAFFGRMRVVALSLDGQKKWQVSVGTVRMNGAPALLLSSLKDVVIVNASVEE